MSEEKIVSYTSEELKRMHSETDWERIHNMTDEEIDAAMADDPVWQELGDDWFDNAIVITPDERRTIPNAIDDEVIAYFKQRAGDDYLAYINAILRAYMKAHPLPDNHTRITLPSGQMPE